MKTHKDYAYTSPEFRFGTGEIHAKLRGTMENLSKEVSVNHAPYELLLWFSIGNIENPTGCTVALSSISLKNVETGEYIPIPKSDNASFKQRSDGAFIASTNYKNLNLKYSDHELQFFYTLDENCGLVASQSSVSMKFEKDYSERNISFWDTLMGV